MQRIAPRGLMENSEQRMKWDIKYEYLKERINGVQRDDGDSFNWVTTSMQLYQLVLFVGPRIILGLSFEFQFIFNRLTLVGHGRADGRTNVVYCAAVSHAHRDERRGKDDDMLPTTYVCVCVCVSSGGFSRKWITESNDTDTEDNINSALFSFSIVSVNPFNTSCSDDDSSVSPHYKHLLTSPNYSSIHCLLRASLSVIISFLCVR